MISQKMVDAAVGAYALSLSSTSTEVAMRAALTAALRGTSRMNMEISNDVVHAANCVLATPLPTEDMRRAIGAALLCRFGEKHSEAVPALLSQQAAPFSPARKPVPEVDQEPDDLNMPVTPMQIARVCHEVNRAYCEGLGDDSQVAWEDAPQWQRDSAMLCVHLHLENPDAGAEASHESWMRQKVLDGWVYGPVKNAVTKEHPCIVPFRQLPPDQQVKDFIFRGVVHALRPEV